MEFESLLKKAGLTKPGLCKVLGIHYQTVMKWKGIPPQYVVAYLTERVARIDAELQLVKCEGMRTAVMQAMGGAK